MSILDKIVKHKKKEVEERKNLYPIKLLEKSIYFESPAVSLKKYLLRPDKSGIIAEFKRKSPSKGYINRYAEPEEVSISYMQAGASALSVLTDKEFFAGSCEDLKTVRKFNFCPVLRKDFIIDEYQIIEAKSIGADAVLLIASILGEKEIVELEKLAFSFGLEVLHEVHKLDELHKLDLDSEKIIGVNNRNLSNFTTDIRTSISLAKHIPDDFVKVSESGINQAVTVKELKNHGFNGFLIGENFMKTSDPGAACKSFVKQVRQTP